MSGTASRYIGGVPYGPAMGVGRYPTQASLLGAPGPRDVGGGVLTPTTDGLGIAVNPATGNVSQQEGGMGSNMLLAAALGLLGYAPDIYNAASKYLGGDGRPVQQRPFPDDPTPTSDGGSPSATPNFPMWSREWFDAIDPTPLGDGAAASDGFGQMGATPGDFASVSDRGAAPATTQGPSGSIFNNPLGLPPEFMGTDPGALGTLGGFDVLANAAYIPSAIIGYGSRTLAKPGGELGATIGSGIGGIIGGIVGGPFGAGVGALAGGGIGGQIGPQPTVGSNFAGTGTFNADGSLAWGGMGGDNGGGAADAQAFANQFGTNLLSQAGAQGLTFNPNMAGVQFNIGGYDNPTRGGEAPGGFFYDPYRSGSPENSALRPNAGLDPYSAAQGNALTSAALADLTARGVFTQGGQTAQDRGYFDQTIGADLGGYGYQTWGQQDLPTFAQLLAQRQGAIGGWMAGAPQRQFDYNSMIQHRDAMYGAQTGPDGNPIYAQQSAPTFIQSDGGA